MAVVDVEVLLRWEGRAVRVGVGWFRVSPGQARRVCSGCIDIAEEVGGHGTNKGEPFACMHDRSVSTRTRHMQQALAPGS